MGRPLGLLGLVLVLAACGSPPPGAPAQPSPTAHGGHASAAPPRPLRDGERFLELAMERPFTPSPARGTDEYRCFLVDPKLTEAAFITGSQFLPQNADLVHHAIFFRVRPEDVAKARDRDAASEGDGWTCFGGAGVGGASARALNGDAEWIAAWAPGAGEVVLEDNTGFEMAPGSQLIMQIHYNLLASKGKPAGSDRSGIRLRLASGAAKLSPLRTRLVAAPVELPCAAGESGPLCEREKAVADVRVGASSANVVAGLSLLCQGGVPKPGPVQACDWPVRESLTVRGAAGHMHLLGRSIKVELNPGRPGAKVLLDIGVYNFDDQSAHPLPAPVKLAPGDTLRVTCTHDAALRRMTPALSELEPRYVVWGDGTADEMCLSILTVTTGA
jgi:Copper type II ascorbate-dependent monooxygenase, C-terminal domain